MNDGADIVDVVRRASGEEERATAAYAPKANRAVRLRRRACRLTRLHALAPPLSLNGPPRAVRPDLGETCFGAGATPVAPSAPSARPPGFPMTETLSRFVDPLAVGAAEN